MGGKRWERDSVAKRIKLCGGPTLLSRVVSFVCSLCCCCDDNTAVGTGVRRRAEDRVTAARG